MQNPLQKKDNEPINFDVDAIQRRVADEITAPVKTLEDLERFLSKWWCKHYNMPYKCAELKEYTFEELLYEYFDISFRSNPEALSKYVNGPMKEVDGEDEEWVKQMMGDNYLSVEEQEKALKGKLEPTTKEDDINFKFDDFV